MHLFYQLTLAAAIVSNTALALLLLKKSSRTTTSISFVIFLALINIWALPYIILNSITVSPLLHELLSKFSSLGYTLFPSAFLVFAISFTSKRSLITNAAFWVVLIVSSLQFLFLNWTTDYIKLHSQSAAIRSYWGIITPNGVLFTWYVIWLEFQMLTSIFLILRQYIKTKDPLFKRQNILILLAVSIPLLFGTVTDAILPLLHISMFPLAIPLSSVMAIIITVAFLKYGVFDLAPWQVLTHAGEGILTLDQDGNISMSNRAAQLMLLLNEKSIVGRSYQEILRFDDELSGYVGAENRPLSLLVSNSHPIIKTHSVLTRSDGSKIHVSMITTPIKQLGKTVGATIVIRDISTEIEAQRQRESFLDFAGHEIKTPFASIKLYASMAERYIRNDNKQESLIYLSKIHHHVDKLSKIIDQLSDLTLIQNKDFNLSLEWCTVGEIIEQATEEIRNAYNARTIKIVGDKNIRLHADKTRLEQVIINLLSNAIKYSPSHSEISINIDRTVNEVIISVVDKGAGIEAQDQEKIFHSFFRSENPETASIPGMGIGLYLVKKIISMHKGRVWVHSKKGKGAAFFFSLPLVVDIR